MAGTEHDTHGKPTGGKTVMYGCIPCSEAELLEVKQWREKAAFKKKKRRKSSRRLRVYTREGYQEYRQSEHWKQKRRQALKHYGRRCASCRTKSGSMHVHHKRYDNLWKEPLADLEVLCASCHADKHRDKIAQSDQ